MSNLTIVKSSIENGEEFITVNRENVDNTSYINAKLIEEKINRLTELTKDFAQVEAGLIIDDLETRKAEFRTLLNEIRVLQGKQPREYNWS